MVKPLVRLYQAGRLEARITLERWVRPGDAEWAEVVIFGRNLEPQFAPLLARLVALGKPYVYDLDDNLCEFRADLEEGRYHSDPARQDQLRSYLRRAALVRVHARALKGGRRRVQRSSRGRHRCGGLAHPPKPAPRQRPDPA